jgi:hypothetical protein
MSDVTGGVPRSGFRVYARKIDIYRERGGSWVYWMSTNAFPTCRSAREHGSNQLNLPLSSVRASFAMRGR